MLLLGIDIGTSGIKATILDGEATRIAGYGYVEYPVDRPLPDKAEQDPESWWQATVIAVGQALSELPSHEIDAIGITGQMHGAVLLDQSQQPVRPAVIWADQRSQDSVDHLISAVGQDRYLEVAGTLPATGFMCATLHWFQTHEPDVLQNVTRVILPKDYVRLKLTGAVVTDYTDAASTGMFDVRQSTWSPEITEAVGVSLDLLPDVIPSTEVVGHLSQAAAEMLGLRPGVPVVAGCADQPAQAVANGIVRAGTLSITVGTGGQIFTPIQRDWFLPDRRLHIFNHVLPDTLYLLGAILAAGSAMRWLRSIVGLPASTESYEVLSYEAGNVSPGADGLLFQPYLSGERTPHMNPHARGAFIGLVHSHGRGHLARAVMEGVAFALRQSQEICCDIAGWPETLVVAGGGMRSPVWRQIMTDVLNLPVQVSQHDEQTCIGAAMLAGVGVGIFASIDDATARVTRLGELIQPNLNRTHYDDLYEQFVDLYPSLVDDFTRLSTRPKP